MDSTRGGGQPAHTRIVSKAHLLCEGFLGILTAISSKFIRAALKKENRYLVEQAKQCKLESTKE